MSEEKSGGGGPGLYILGGLGALGLLGGGYFIMSARAEAAKEAEEERELAREERAEREAAAQRARELEATRAREAEAQARRLELQLAQQQQQQQQQQRQQQQQQPNLGAELLKLGTSLFNQAGGLEGLVGLFN